MLPSASNPRNRATRDLRLDGLRGLLLVIMALNHITTDLRVISEHPLGFVSAAEGFVFLAGLVAGFVFMRRRLRDGAAAARLSAWRRARAIYWAHLGLLAFVCAWVLAFKAIAGTTPGNAPELLSINPIASLLAGPFLMYQPPLLDILPLYTGFMLLLPALLSAYARGHRATVVGASFGLWALTNAFVTTDLTQPGLFFTGAFNPFAWQLLFVVGSACGDAWARGESVVRTNRPGLVCAALAISIACFLVRHAFVPPLIPDGLLHALENKNILAPLRLLNIAALFYVFYVAMQAAPRAFHWPPLALLGRHSLPVFAVHGAVAYILYAFPQYVSSTPSQRWLGTGIMIGSMFVTAGVHAWWQARQRRQRVTLQPRHEWVHATIVHHGKRPSGAADALHR